MPQGSPPPTPTAKRKDPLPGFCFLVRFTEVVDTTDSYFRSVSGLRTETEVIPVRAGGALTTFNLVGAVKFSPIVLKQGFMETSALMKWRQLWLTPGSMVRSGGQIIQLNTALKPMMAWNFYRGWPSKWELGEFDASKSELSIETLEIVHEGLEIADSVPAD